MADTVEPAHRSRIMSGIGQQSTAPELVVRRWLHAKGFRFRVNQKELPGRPDIVLRRYNAVVFVHGCFWHAHRGCKYWKVPATRPEFWRAKFDANRERDARKEDELMEDGWRVAIVWECATRKNDREENLQLLAEWIKGDLPRFESAVRNW